MTLAKKQIMDKITDLYNSIIKRYIEKHNLPYGPTKETKFYLTEDKRVDIVRYEDGVVDIDIYTPFIADRRDGALFFRFALSGKFHVIYSFELPSVHVKLEDLLEGYRCMKELSIKLV